MREAEVYAGLVEAQSFERDRYAMLTELMGISSQLVRFLGGKSRLRGILGVDDVNFRALSDGLTIEIPGGQIDIRMKLDTASISFIKQGPNPMSRKTVKKLDGVSPDRMVSVLKKYSKSVR